MMISDLWYLRQMDRFITGDDPLVIDLDARHAARCRSGGDDDLARLERLLFPVGDLDRAAAGEPGRPLDPGDLVLLEQELDALREPAHDLVLACVHLRHVDRWRAIRNDNSPLLRVLNDLQGMGMLEQRLGWNATPDQTGATEDLLFLDNGDRLTELSGPDGRDVAASSGADHHDIVRIGRHNRLV
jgi:hypothetical protein